MSQTIWNLKRLKEIRNDIRDELALIEKESGLSERLAHITRRVHDLHKDTSSLSLLKCYTYVCSGLVHHMRHGELQTREITRFADIAEKLLRVQGIDPFQSRLSFLYGDVHSMIGQIRRAEGSHWEALWHHQMAFQHTRTGPEASTLFHLAYANRALRLGHCIDAITSFTSVIEDEKADVATYQAAVLGKMKACRLHGNIDMAKKVKAEANLTRFNEDGRIELTWEESCLDVAAGASLNQLLQTEIASSRPRHRRAETLMKFTHEVAILCDLMSDGRGECYPTVRQWLCTPKRRTFCYFDARME